MGVTNVCKYAITSWDKCACVRVCVCVRARVMVLESERERARERERKRWHTSGESWTKTLRAFLVEKDMFCVISVMSARSSTIKSCGERMPKDCSCWPSACVFVCVCLLVWLKCTFTVYVCQDQFVWCDTFAWWCRRNVCYIYIYIHTHIHTYIDNMPRKEPDRKCRCD
jgi:hypothetical protein